MASLERDQGDISGIVIAVKGEPGQKWVEGRFVNVIPFVGSEFEGESSQIGVGIIETGRKPLWAWQSRVIQSWRAMKFLEQIPVIDPNFTLCACWYAGAREDRQESQQYFDKLSEVLGGADQFSNIRKQILNQTPDPKLLEEMLSTFHQSGVQIDSSELREEMAAGRIPSSPLIEQLIAEDERRKESLTARLEALEAKRLAGKAKPKGNLFRRLLDLGEIDETT